MVRLSKKSRRAAIFAAAEPTPPAPRIRIRITRALFPIERRNASHPGRAMRKPQWITARTTESVVGASATVEQRLRRRPRLATLGVAPTTSDRGQRLEHHAVRERGRDVGMVVGRRDLDHVEPD